jgi:hypothetical protein
MAYFTRDLEVSFCFYSLSHMLRSISFKDFYSYVTCDLHFLFT